MDTTAVVTRNLIKEYKNGTESFRALDGVQLIIESGEFVGLVGPSGSGKTTFLNIVGALDSPTGGKAVVLGKDVNQLRHSEAAALRNTSLGFIFQTYNLLPVYSVYENVEFPLLLLKVPKPERERRVKQALEWLGLETKARSRPSQISGGYTSAWSAPETFVTPAADAPARPAIGSPANNIKLFSASPVVSWYVPAAPAAALRYDVEYSDKADFSNAVKITGVQKKFAALSNLLTGKTYFWRVRGKNTNGDYSQYSGSGVFRVESPTGVTTDAAIPGVFALEQNYPNPFNPATTIKYSIAEKSNVKLAVFDMLGREVALLVNGEQENGNYSVEFNAAKLASGVYFYKLQSGNATLTKKFVILK